MKFEIGALVCEKYDHAYQGKVIALLENNEVMVKWKHGSTTCPVDELILVDEEADKKLAANIQKKIDKAASLFEKAFKEFEAAKSLDDAGFISHSNFIDLSVLSAVMDRHGWSSSSLYC